MRHHPGRSDPDGGRPLLDEAPRFVQSQPRGLKILHPGMMQPVTGIPYPLVDPHDRVPTHAGRPQRHLFHLNLYKILGFSIKLSIPLNMSIKGIYEWDDTKRQANLHKHGLDFTDMVHFDWDTAQITLIDHPSEERWIAIGFLKLTLCFVVYAERGDHIRLISLRKATRKERDYYAKK